MSRRKDKPLPLQPSDLSDTTFDSFGLKRIDVIYLLDKYFSGPWTLLSAVCAFEMKAPLGLRDAGRGASSGWLVSRACFAHAAAGCGGRGSRHLLGAFMSRELCLHAETGSQRQIFQKFDLKTAFFSPPVVWRKH